MTLSFDDKYKICYFNGKDCHLTFTEYKFLRYLYKKKKLVNTYDILDEVFGEAYDRTNITHYVMMIRKKTSFDLIKNRHGYGYFLDIDLVK